MWMDILVVLEEIIEKTWPLLTLKLDPGNPWFLTSLFWICVLLAIPVLEAAPKIQLYDKNMSLRPSGQCMWLNQVKDST